MERSLEKVAAELLKDIEKLKTPECLSVDTLGDYIEHTLPSEEWDRVETHLRSCLYCLNQLVELRELLFLEENAEPLPRFLERRLRRLATQETQSILVTWLEVSKEYASATLETARAIFNSRYTWQTVSVVILAIMLFRYPGLIPKKPEDDTKRIAMENREPNVTAREKGASGATVGEGAKLFTVPLGVYSRLGGEGSQINQATAHRIVSALQNLGKTLILERTRGQIDAEVYSRAAQAVVFVTDAEWRSAGSGAIIDAEGHILTNWHVVRDRPRVFVVLKPRDSSELKKELVYAAVVEKVDEEADLAYLRMLAHPASLKYLQIGDAETLAVGQDVHAIGHPEGQTWTYTKGIISQIRDNYEWSPGDGRTHRAKVIQTQTPINPGNSGGPLLDDSGRLIGINSFFSPQAQGLNFAVAVDAIQQFLQRPGNRLARPDQQRNVEGKPRCPDAYDTTGRGWNDIVGCYRTDSPPPPDLWFVLHAPEQVAYIALSNLGKGQIDTVIRSPEQKWEERIHLIDVDCNGTIDLIGYQGKGSDGITSFSLPPKPVRMLTLAKELDTALKLRKIPYRNLKVCQGIR